MSNIKELAFNFELKKELLQAEFEFRARKQGWYPCMVGEEPPTLMMVDSPLFANGAVVELPQEVNSVTHPFAF